VIWGRYDLSFDICEPERYRVTLLSQPGQAEICLAESAARYSGRE
jgi:hypothetical protein